MSASPPPPSPPCIRFLANCKHAYDWLYASEAGEVGRSGRSAALARGLLILRRMNSHYFGIKRTYYGVLGRTRKGLSKAGLTSARYDVLTALWRWGEMLQRDIRHAMGVTRSTISRMLRALETLGLLVRARAEDRRNLVVRITPGGRRAIDSVSARDLWSEEGEQLAWASTSLPGLDGSWYDLLFSMDFVHYEAETNRMARVFGKAFGPYPPYHPDD